MNKFVKQQLAKCRVVLPPYDDNTTHMIIPFKTNTMPTQTINTSYKFTTFDSTLNISKMNYFPIINFIYNTNF